MTIDKTSAKRGWEQYAQDRPEFAVLTNGSTGEVFLASGHEAVAERLKLVASLGHPLGKRALDFGCGVGRLTLPLAEHFAHVIGVDHSRTMIAIAAKRAKDRAVRNVAFLLSQGNNLPHVADGCIDFVLSLLVFQHIPTWTAVVSNLREIARVLVPGGLALLQFDTRPRTVLYCTWDLVEPLLPHGIGPQTRRAPLRRYRRRSADLDDLFASLGLQVTYQRGRNTATHEYLLQRMASL